MPAATAARRNDTGGEVKVARPPLAMSGQMPSPYAYPGIIGHHPDATCNLHQSPMYSFAGDHLVCLHCVEFDLSELLHEPEWYHDRFLAELGEKSESWKRLAGAAKQAASCAKTTPELSVVRFVVLAAHRHRVPTDIISARVLGGDVQTLVPHTT